MLLRLVLALAAIAAAPSLVRAEETVLYHFKGGSDGRTLFRGMVFDKEGALYGTTVQGGASDHGTVFKLTPPAAGKTQ